MGKQKKNVLVLVLLLLCLLSRVWQVLLTSTLSWEFNILVKEPNQAAAFSFVFLFVFFVFEG